MSILSRTQIRMLVEHPSQWCASIFLPTHPAGRESQQDPIRLKNLLDEAEERLVEDGLRAPEARDLLKPGRDLLDNSQFWRHVSDGLAVFLAPDLFRHYRIPYRFESLVVVGDRFHLKPLLPLLSGDGQFYVLAVSQNDVRLFQATRDSIGVVELEDVPTSLAEALRFDDPERQLQFHTGTGMPAGTGRRPALFHGQGIGVNESKEDILRYFHKLDRGLTDLLQGERTPLVLAAVDYLHPLYREANSWPGLLQEGITGNPDEWSAAELHRKGWALVEPRFEAEQEEAAARYKEAFGTGLASDDVRRIVPAAAYGRVDTLFVAVGEQQWGQFDESTGEVDVHEEAHPGDRDLLDLAAVQTLLNGGTVYAVGRERVPGQGRLAAIFRH